MELTSLQKKAVERIIALYDPTAEKGGCEFKAPTGSGKTLMASYFISRMIEQFVDDNFIFVIATPSSSSLPLAFEQKLNKYKPDLPYSNFSVEYILSPSSAKNEKTEALQKIIAEKNKVYIFGKASFGRGRLLQEYGIIEDFIKSAVEDKRYKIIYIRDEAHIGGETADKGDNAKNFEALMDKCASFTLKMTATPKSISRVVTLSEKDLNNPLLNEGRWLLKTQAIPLLNKDLLDTELLADAIKNFKQIKREYATISSVANIHPAMLIQVDNEPTDSIKKAEFLESLSVIKKYLNDAGLSWVQYFGNNDKDSNRVYKSSFSLDDITQNNNDIDVILFKIGPATGWDIPRACMLVQLRNVSSTSLNIQTLGRIKRNPYPLLQRNEVTDKYYVYSNSSNEKNEIKTYNYNILQQYEEVDFLSIKITNKKNIKELFSKTNAKFIKLLDEYLESKKEYLIQEINTIFTSINGRLVYRKLVSTSNGHGIYSIIENPYIFLREYKRFIASKKFVYDFIAVRRNFLQYSLIS